MVADAFTKAFVSVKVEEVLTQMGECFECACTFDGLECALSILNGSCSHVPGEKRNYVIY